MGESLKEIDSLIILSFVSCLDHTICKFFCLFGFELRSPISKEIPSTAITASFYLP